MLRLINQSGFVLNVGLAHQHSVASATLRKNRSVPTPLRIMPGDSVDICEYLGVSLEAARQVVADSVEVTHFCRNGQLAVMDSSGVVQGKLYTIDFIEYPPLQLKQVNSQEVRRNERVIEPTEYAKEEEAQAATELAQAVGITASTEFSDSVPSARWSREKLLQYAKDRGINVPDNISRNALLKKLRS